MYSAVGRKGGKRKIIVHGLKVITCIYREGRGLAEVALMMKRGNVTANQKHCVREKLIENQY